MAKYCSKKLELRTSMKSFLKALGPKKAFCNMVCHSIIGIEPVTPEVQMQWLNECKSYLNSKTSTTKWTFNSEKLLAITKAIIKLNTCRESR